MYTIAFLVFFALLLLFFMFFFFFQAEDGIRDLTVTGVQTCALPILNALAFSVGERGSSDRNATALGQLDRRGPGRRAHQDRVRHGAHRRARRERRSEERRVGKECRSRWSPYH